MSNTKLVWVMVHLCFVLVLEVKADEGALDNSFHTTHENGTIDTEPTPTEVSEEAVPIIGPVVGGFLGCLLLFLLIACCLICYARCKSQQEEDKAGIVNSFSNPSWIGSDSFEKNSKCTTENEYVEQASPPPKETTLKSLPVVDNMLGLF